MAAKLKFITADEVCSIQVENDGRWLILKFEDAEFDGQFEFDYETALALRNQIDLVLKIIEPVKPTQ